MLFALGVKAIVILTKDLIILRERYSNQFIAIGQKLYGHQPVRGIGYGREGKELFAGG
jgi:hypothetical protein